MFGERPDFFGDNSEAFAMFPWWAGTAAGTIIELRRRRRNAEPTTGEYSTEAAETLILNVGAREKK